MTVEDLSPAADQGAPAVSPDTAAPSAPEPSEDDALGAIYDAAMKDHDAGTAQEGQQAADEGTQERDPATGRFKSTKPEEGAQENAEGEGEGEQASLEGEDAGAKPGSTAADAPAHLPQAIKAAWKDIPEAARDAIATHQAEMDRKFSDIGRQLQQVKPLSEKLTEATTQYPQFQGMTPEQLAQGAVELAAVQARLESANPVDRVKTVLEIAHHYGVLPALKSMMTGQQGDQSVQSLHQEIADLKRQLGDRGQQPQITPEMIEEQVSKSIAQRDSEAIVDRFLADTGSYPFVNDVANDLPVFIATVKEKQPGLALKDTLAAAYDMAINADPVVRQKVRELEASAKAQATTSEADTKRKEAAERAASSNLKSQPGGKKREMTEEEALGAAFDRATAA